MPEKSSRRKIEKPVPGLPRRALWLLGSPVLRGLTFGGLLTGGLLTGGLLTGALLTGILGSQTAIAAGAKYYFELHDVESLVPLNGETRKFAGDALKDELASRPEWESDLGGGKNRDAVVAALKKRGLAGFDVMVKIAELKKEVKEPKPGSRLKRLSISVKLSVLGTTLPGEKIAFGGNGEAGAETEVTDRRIDVESDSLTKDAIKDAVKQAVDQAVLKLGAPKSAPMNESKRKHKKTP
jgi:hypothetical protein